MSCHESILLIKMSVYICGHVHMGYG